MRSARQIYDASCVVSSLYPCLCHQSGHTWQYFMVLVLRAATRRWAYDGPLAHWKAGQAHGGHSRASMPYYIKWPSQATPHATYTRRSSMLRNPQETICTTPTPEKAQTQVTRSSGYANVPCTTRDARRSASQHRTDEIEIRCPRLIAFRT